MSQPIELKHLEGKKLGVCNSYDPYMLLRFQDTQDIVLLVANRVEVRTSLDELSDEDLMYLDVISTEEYKNRKVAIDKEVYDRHIERERSEYERLKRKFEGWDKVISLVEGRAWEDKGNEQ